jgi:hypothetical protein
MSSVSALCARRLLALLALPVLATACSTSDVTAPPATVAGSFTVDASTSWAYISLADSAVVTPAPSAAESLGWDIGFSATNVAINTAAGVTATCLCQNAGATNEQVLAMTAASEQADFDAVTSVPATATFAADAFTTNKYFRYNILGDHRISPTFDVYLIKRGTAVYALQVIGYYDSTNKSRQVSFRYKQIAR